MSTEIRLLQIEDSPDDAELMLRLLKKAGFLVYSERIETAAEMRELLARQPWDVIVADYRLPNFDAPSALSVLHETGNDIPFIVVSGAIGEEVAVEMMRSGAHDYLLKDRLERLASAVEREIHAARIRRQHRQAQEERSAAHSELRETVDRLELALLDKAVLFQEVHHRVKNNLQIVASLLAMQSRAMRDPDAAGKLRDTEQRVKAMALVHEQLYGQKEISSVDLAAYFRTLAPQLVATHPANTSIALRLDLAPTSLSLEQSIPCGLILTELITNALKYAYPEGHGEIAVQLSSGESAVELTVSDTGVGLPDGFDLKNSKTLGMTLVQALAKQIGGSLEIGPAPGCAFTVRIPTDAEKSVRRAAQKTGRSPSTEQKQNLSQVAVW